MRLPGPGTWAEGQRGLMSWLMAAAGVFSGFCIVFIVLLLWLGGWTVQTEAQRLTIISIALVAFAFGMIAVILALAVGGPVGRFKANLSKDGGGMELEGDTATVTTTTQTQVTP